VTITGTDPANRPVAPIAGNGITWYHVKATDVRDVEFIRGLCAVKPLDLYNCVSEQRLPTVVTRESYLFALFHFPRVVPEKGTIAPSQLGVFLSKEFLVTAYQSELTPVSRLHAICQSDARRRQELFEGGTGNLLYFILNSLVDSLSNMLDDILGAMERIEDEVFDDRRSSARTLGLLRRDIADQRRILYPAASLIEEIRSKTKQYGTHDLDLQYEDLHDKMVSVWHTLESMAERIEIFKDADYILSTAKTNKILGALTIVFTLTVPATTVGALYGMNVSLPGGVDAGGLAFWGRHTTFFVILLATLVPAGILVLLFRKWGWL
jgi:magnesium transporter